MSEPTYEEPTNDERANRIPPTINAYVRARGDEPDTDDSDYKDLLTDLMHFAYREGYDFHQWLTTAEVNFNAEVSQEEDPEDLELPGDCAKKGTT